MQINFQPFFHLKKECIFVLSFEKETSNAGMQLVRDRAPNEECLLIYLENTAGQSAVFFYPFFVVHL